MDRISLERYQQISNLPLNARRIYCSGLLNILDVTREGRITHQNTKAAMGNKFEMKKIKYYRIDHDVKMTETQLAKLQVIGLAQFYLYDEKNVNIDPNLNDTIGGYLTILAAFATPQHFEGARIGAQLVNYDIQLVEEVLTPITLEAVYLELWPAVSAHMKISNIAVYKSRIICLALASLLLIGKRLNANNLIGWYNNTICAISSILAKAHTPDGIFPPSVDAVQAANTALSVKHTVRKAIFELLRTLARNVAVRYHEVFAMLVRMLAFTEMTHIAIILQHVFLENPEILAMPEFEREKMDKVFDYIRSKDVADLPYLKLLYPQHETDVLNSAHFPMLTAAARTILFISEPTMTRDQITKNDGPLVYFCDRVRRFIIQKRASQNVAEALARIANVEAAAKLITL